VEKRRLRDRIGQPATILGPGVTLQGSIEGSGHFLVSGRVIGKAEIDGALTLAESASWKGDIRAQDLILAGELEGEVQARGSIEITASARIRGRVTAHAIAVSAGAVIEADLHTQAEAGVVRFDERRRG
jgi:cytoskeletal protein CcmA (bactofilin family)